MTDFEKTYQNYNPRQAALDEARALLTAAAKAAMADGTLPEAELPAFIVEIPADVKNGDIASNLAMAGARTWRKAPRMIAEALLAHLPDLLRADGAWVYYEVPAENFFILTWMIDADKAAEKVASLKDEEGSLACIVDLTQEWTRAAE